MRDSIQLLIGNIGVILSSISTILMFFYQSVWWLGLVVIGVFCTILLKLIEGRKETATYISNIIAKRSDEFKENILNPSENSSVFYVNAPYKNMKNTPPYMNLWNKYWGERSGRSELRFKDRFENYFKDAKGKPETNELLSCFFRLREELQHYYVSLCEFSKQFEGSKDDAEVKSWFSGVVDTYNNYVNKLEEDIRDIQLKLTKEIKLNVTKYKMDW